MKKIIILITLLSLNFTLANNKKTSKKVKAAGVQCCTKVATSGTSGTNTWKRVSITKCIEGPYDNLAFHQACMWASQAAKDELNMLQQPAIHHLTID
jgi:hypothetical protein